MPGYADAFGDRDTWAEREAVYEVDATYGDGDRYADGREADMVGQLPPRPPFGHRLGFGTHDAEGVVLEAPEIDAAWLATYAMDLSDAMMEQVPGLEYAITGREFTAKLVAELRPAIEAAVGRVANTVTLDALSRMQAPRAVADERRALPRRSFGR